MHSIEAAVIHLKARPDIRLEVPNKSMNLCEDVFGPGKDVKGYAHEFMSVYCISHTR
jgi:hypothetical protein